MRWLHHGRTTGWTDRCGSGVVPVLLSEISSPRNRGAVGSIHQLMINLGILCSGLLGYALVRDVDHGWRYVQGFIVAPAIAQVCVTLPLFGGR